MACELSLKSYRRRETVDLNAVEIIFIVFYFIFTGYRYTRIFYIRPWGGGKKKQKTI